jgi:hypothetical protein
MEHRIVKWNQFFKICIDARDSVHIFSCGWRGRGGTSVIISKPRLSSAMKFGKIFGVVLIAAAFAAPQARSEANLSGAWSGGGIVRYSDGHSERARCRAQFSQSGARVSLEAHCATPSGSVDQSASLHRVGPNSFAGSFFNQQFNVSGSIHITVHGNSQTVSLRSSSGSASLTLHH